MHTRADHRQSRQAPLLSLPPTMGKVKVDLMVPSDSAAVLAGAHRGMHAPCV